MDNLQFYIFSHLIIGAISIVLGLTVLFKNTASKINRVFFFLGLSVSVWSITYAVWLLADNPASGLFWSRVLNLAALSIPVFYFHWVLCFLDIKKDKALYLFYSLTIFFAFFSFNPLYITGTHAVFNFPYWPIAGPVYLAFLLSVWIAIIIYSLGLLVKSLSTKYGHPREQTKYVLIGSLIGFVGGSTNYLLMMKVNIFPPIGSPLVVAFPAMFAYAMVKHRLMDIKFVMRRYAVYSVSMGIVFVVLLIVKYYVNIYLPTFASLIDYLLLFLAVLVFPSIKNKIYHLANKYFFSSLYDTSKVIALISEKLRSTLNIDQIYQFIFESIDNAMHVKSFGILRFNKKKNIFSTEFNINFNIGRRVNFEHNEYLQSRFIEKNEPIVVSEVKHTMYNNETKETIDMLEAMRVDILYPLTVKDKVVGLIVLGAKESGDMYNNEDLQVFSIVAAQSAIAIENAMLYEETKNFGERMEDEVKKATKDLRAANVRLTKLDAAKSEFISIASHQLRTPLTVIKGYISMMLEGSFGEINDKIKGPMENVFESNERLIHLVENLLNISRIESGRLKFNYQTVQLESLIESVITELRSTAEDKGIKLEFNRLKRDLPKVKIDTEKIRQVIMNLTDNAIKYTNKGKVVVMLRKKGDDLLFSVSDKGMGISEEDLPTLFKKFARGSGAKTEHTEGTGLGLYVARQMIEAHKGKAWAESKGEGKGSKFCFLLPIK